MDPRPDRDALERRFFNALLDTVLPLKTGPDPEVTLEAMVRAAEMLQEHLEAELAELRVEQVE